MSDQQVKRKLAAILSADVNGFSRLLGEDEASYINTLFSYLALMTDLIDRHGGRVVNKPGDGILAEFSSVVDATECALEIQKELKTRNDNVPDQKMEFRIGINIGDVIQEDGSIFGQAVNIAERVQGVAKGGDICMTDTAFYHVKDRLEVSCEDLGKRKVKNVEEPIHVYKVSANSNEYKVRAGSRKRAKIRYWRSRVPRIFSLLAATIVVAGSIVGLLYTFRPSLFPGVKITSASPTGNTISIDAHTAFDEGWRYLSFGNDDPENIAKAKFYFERAIDFDPNYNRAFAGLAMVYWKATVISDLTMRVGVTSWAQARLKSLEYLRKAMEKPTATAHQVASRMYLQRRQYEQAEIEANRALALDPNDRESYLTAGYVRLMAGHPDDAKTLFSKGVRLDVTSPNKFYYYLAITAFHAGKLDEAVDYLERLAKLHPKFRYRHGLLAAIYALQGKSEQARAAIEIYRGPRSPNVTGIMYFWAYKDMSVAQRHADGLEKAGLLPGLIGNPKISTKMRVTGNQMESLFFGRTIATVGPAGEKLSFSCGKDGRAIWHSSGDDDIGKMWVEGETVCVRWAKRQGGFPYCGTVFRNPEGKPEKNNEYFWITDIGLVMFSSLPE